MNPSFPAAFRTCCPTSDGLLIKNEYDFYYIRGNRPVNIEEKKDRSTFYLWGGPLPVIYFVNTASSICVPSGSQARKQSRSASASMVRKLSVSGCGATVTSSAWFVQRFG